MPRQALAAVLLQLPLLNDRLRLAAEKILELVADDALLVHLEQRRFGRGPLALTPPMAPGGLLTLLDGMGLALDLDRHLAPLPVGLPAAGAAPRAAAGSGPARAAAAGAAMSSAGTSGGRRRSEVAAARVEDLVAVDGGYLFRLRRSKTDQAGEGLELPVLGRAARALAAWLAAAGLTEGPLFRPLSWYGRRGAGLSDRSVAEIVKARAALAGRQPGRRHGALRPPRRRGGPALPSGRSCAVEPGGEARRLTINPATLAQRKGHHVSRS